jgi:hypothetical protein
VLRLVGIIDQSAAQQPAYPGLPQGATTIPPQHVLHKIAPQGARPAHCNWCMRAMGGKGASPTAGDDGRGAAAGKPQAWVLGEGIMDRDPLFATNEFRITSFKVRPALRPPRPVEAPRLPPPPPPPPAPVKASPRDCAAARDARGASPAPTQPHTRICTLDPPTPGPELRQQGPARLVRAVGLTDTAGGRARARAAAAGARRSRRGGPVAGLAAARSHEVDAQGSAPHRRVAAGWARRLARPGGPPSPCAAHCVSPAPAGNGAERQERAGASCGRVPAVGLRSS